MELKEALKERYSCRSFSNKKVSWDQLIDLADAATLAPKSGGTDIWRLILIEEKGTINKIASLSEQMWISTAPAIIVLCSTEKLLEHAYGERGRVYSRQQAGAAIQNLLLKATNQGLGACWVGSFPDPQIRKILKIPAEVLIEAIIPVGYPSKEEATKPQKMPKSIESFLRWESYGTKKRPTPALQNEPNFKHR